MTTESEKFDVWAGEPGFPHLDSGGDAAAQPSGSLRRLHEKMSEVCVWLVAGTQ